MTGSDRLVCDLLPGIGSRSETKASLEAFHTSNHEDGEVRCILLICSLICNCCCMYLGLIQTKRLGSCRLSFLWILVG